MAGNITTTSNFAPVVLQSAAEKLLAVKVPYLIHRLPCVRRKMVARGGTTIRFPRMNKFSTATTPLGVSGITPPPEPLSYMNIDATLSFYGKWTGINEQVILQNQIDVVNEAIILLGINMRETEDELVRNRMLSGASVINATHGTNGDTPSNLSLEDVQIAITTLRSNDARMFTGGIIGEDRFGTGPVRAAYIALCSTDLEPDLNNLPGFISKWNYPRPYGVAKSSLIDLETVVAFS